MLNTHYTNDDLFDLTEKHFVLDARAAWVTDIKLLIDHLIKQKKIICELLPKCTMLLNRTLFHLQNWRKDLQIRQDTTNTNSSNQETSPLSAYSSPNTKYPIISLKHFNQRMREYINPLASDEHLNELIKQLQLMGEIVFLQYSHTSDGDHMICFQPEWLCHKILGHLFSYDRYSNINPVNLNGIYTGDHLKYIYSNVCTNTRLLKEIFIALDLCVELTNEKSGEPMYEFPSLNFLSESLPLAFQTVKNCVNCQKSSKSQESQKQTLYVFNGFRLKTTPFHLVRKQQLGSMSRSLRSSMLISAPVVGKQLANLFFRIQVNLRYLTKNFYIDPADEDEMFGERNSEKSTKGKENIGKHFTHIVNILGLNFEEFRKIEKF